MIKKIYTSGLLSLALSTQILSAVDLAKVNGETITDRDLLPIIAQITGGRYGNLDNPTQIKVQNMALEQSIARVLLENEAKKSGVTNNAEFKEQLELAIKKIKRQLTFDMWLNNELEKQAISSAEMKDYYNKNKSEFKKPKTVHARHILVKTEDEAKGLIGLLSKYAGDKLKNEFIESAKNMSIEPGASERGGDLGYFPEGVMVPEFNKAVFSMTVGTISKTPVKTQFGFHVIYLEDKKEASQATFEEAEQVIEQKIKVEKFQKFVEKKIEYLKSKADIKMLNGSK